MYTITILVLSYKRSTFASRTARVKSIKIDISEVEKSALYRSKTWPAKGGWIERKIKNWYREAMPVP